jgi:HAD superfamily hydrolase (TIGR01549 family)
MPDTAIFDVDGTLVDSNYHHALAWFRAFRQHGLTIPIWHLHRAIGMGGDHLVAHVAGDDVEQQHGDAIRAAQTDQADTLIGEVCALSRARDLLEQVRQRGFRLVLATSGQPRHTERLLDLLDAAPLVDTRTSSEDVPASKPAPDVLHDALARAGGASAVLVGDSTWDGVAAQRAGVGFLAVRTGGFSRDELTDAGAQAVFDSLDELVDALDDTPLARPS